MPHAARFKVWDDTPESEAAARSYSHNFLQKYALRARENACSRSWRTRWAGGVRRALAERQREPASPRRRRHDLAAGRRIIASTQQERIREEMIVATLDAALLAVNAPSPIICSGRDDRSYSENWFGDKSVVKEQAGNNFRRQGSSRSPLALLADSLASGERELPVCLTFKRGSHSGPVPKSAINAQSGLARVAAA